MATAIPSSASEGPDSAAESYGAPIAPDSVRLERVLPGPIERVWSYLTDSNLRGKWLARGAMQVRAGGRVELHFHHADLSPHVEPVPQKYRGIEAHCDFVGRVTRCETPRLLSYTWGEPSGAESEVTFELTPRGRDVLLVLTHTRLAGRDAMISVAGGWHVHLGILIDVLNAREPRPFWSTHTALEAAYEKRFTADQPTTRAQNKG